MFNRTICGLVVLVAVFIAAMETYAAEPHSSIFQIQYPGSTVHVNSSQQGDTCIVSYKSGSSGDLHFRFDSIVSDYGILYDEAVDNRIKSLMNPNVFDSEAKFYFDLMLSEEALVAPQSGYKSSAPAGKTAYFIKTSPATYGLIINFFNYFGGIDRHHYYLVRNEEGESRLFKEVIQDLPSSLSFVAEVFSGRRNPVFTIKNQANVKKLLCAIYKSTDYIRNPSLVIQNPDPWPPLSTFFIYDIFNGCSGNNIEVKVAREMVRITRRSNVVYMSDFSSKLYLTILEVGRDENPVSVDDVGPVYFKDIFPVVNNGGDTVSGKIPVNSGSKIVIKDF
ncbi:MAG: hypothetical protein GX640_11710, partial [Fibrobacter sp.]|nr:hypothetical protein [Fibrobacter sp.]